MSIIPDPLPSTSRAAGRPAVAVIGLSGRFPGARNIEEFWANLKAGRSLVIFPEGTRSKSGLMNPFKEGSFKLATRSGASIVPVTIDGSYRLLEGNHGRIRPGTVRLTIHPPLAAGDWASGDKAALAESVQRIIASALPS